MKTLGEFIVGWMCYNKARGSVYLCQNQERFLRIFADLTVYQHHLLSLTKHFLPDLCAGKTICQITARFTLAETARLTLFDLSSQSPHPPRYPQDTSRSILVVTQVLFIAFGDKKTYLKLSPYFKVKPQKYLTKRKFLQLETEKINHG